MRIIVCGSREWTDRERIVATLEHKRIHAPSLTVVHGDCSSGADAIAAQWCRQWRPYAPLSVTEEPHPADWNKHGKAAGPIRNQAMADTGAELCLAFWTGESRGTLDMITRAVKAGIPVRIVPPKK